MIPSGKQPRAVVFGYHDVGVRCLLTLLAHGVEVPLVVTHADDPKENHWFGSVAATAALYDIPVIRPESPTEPGVTEQVAASNPDFLFSFYYRHLLPPELLEMARCGAYNMHGSLLPAYRGRAPVNWAILKGERETGTSLHHMVAKADAGDLVGQWRVPILPDDTALQVFRKVTCAAEQLLDSQLPALLSGQAQHQPLNLSAGSYCGRRRPEDGRIDWRQSAQDIHNLVRAVAPPYPGAFFDLAGKRVNVLASLYRGQDAQWNNDQPAIYWQDGVCFADCADGKRLRILDIQVDGSVLDEHRCSQLFGAPCMKLIQETVRA